MFSPAITASSIVSILHDLDLLLRILEGCEFSIDLKHFKMFLLMSRINFDNQHRDDPNLPSLFMRIQDTVHKFVETFPPDVEFWHVEEDVYNKLRSNNKSLLDEIGERYFTMRDSVVLQLCDSLDTIEDISIIITSISDVLEDIHDQKEMEDLLEQLQVLQTLVFFVDKPTPQLLAHYKNVAIHTYLLLMSPRSLHGLSAEKRLLDFKTSRRLVQRIKPIDPLISETYIQALSTSKLARQLSTSTHQEIDDSAFVATMNFLDSLIHNLRELLQLNTVRVHSAQDQILELYRTFRSLRAILKRQQPLNNIKVDIVTLVFDAGILIFSLYRTHTEVDLQYFHDLLKTTKSILLQLGNEDPPVQAFNFPKTNQLGYVDFVLGKLVDMTGLDAELTANSKDVQTIHEELLSLRSFLGDIVEFRQEYEDLQALWNHILDVVYKAECLNDHFLASDLPISSSPSVDAIMEDIKDIKRKIEGEIEGKRQQNRLKGSTRTYSHMSSQTISLEKKNEVVGFADDAKLIMDRLKRGSKQLKVIAIVGMPGLGKTTLATKVFNDRSISLHFHVCAWCPISQTWDKMSVLFQLLKQVSPEFKCLDINEQDLVEQLRRKLKGKRYLIYLDDIWNIEAWNSLAPAFPNEKYGSRIILTSLNQNGIVPSHILDQEPHFLQLLKENESFQLFQKKLFQRNDGLDLALRDLLMRFVVYCKGLPLSIILIAGVLANTKPDDWVKIWDDLNSGDASITNHCMELLELSYKSLPDYLKPCFLYFGVFPEDTKIPTNKLLYLWIAEGFVSKVQGKHIRDVAGDYLNGLIGRSLIMVVEKRWNNRIKTCQMHDLLLDYCLQKAKDENFLHLVKGNDELLAFNEPHNLRRLCIQSSVKHFKESKLFCPHARSLHFHDTNGSLHSRNILDVSFVISIFRLLRVLDLGRITLMCEFPSDISLLVQLAFLAIKGTFKCIPASIVKLSNLETLIVHPGEYSISFPESMWNLQKLRYLLISFSYGIVPVKNLDNSPILYELDVFSGVEIRHGYLERILKKCPNLCKLKCCICSDEYLETGSIVILDFLEQLKSVYLWGKSKTWNVDFRFPTNLKKLKLNSFSLSCENMSTIGGLPNLQFLKLANTKFEGDIWEVKEEFTQLRYLNLYEVDLVCWRAYDGQLECLQKLKLTFCRELKNIPRNCLENIQTLETIEAHYCSRTVERLIKLIEEQQVEQLGNTNFKIKIVSRG